MTRQTRPSISWMWCHLELMLWPGKIMYIGVRVLRVLRKRVRKLKGIICQGLESMILILNLIKRLHFCYPIAKCHLIRVRKINLIAIAAKEVRVSQVRQKNFQNLHKIMMKLKILSSIQKIICQKIICQKIIMITFTITIDLIKFQMNHNLYQTQNPNPNLKCFLHLTAFYQIQASHNLYQFYHVQAKTVKCLLSTSTN